MSEGNDSEEEYIDLNRTIDNKIELYQIMLNEEERYNKVAIINNKDNVFDIIIKEDIEINKERYNLYNCLYILDEIEVLKNNNMKINIIKMEDEKKDYYAIAVDVKTNIYYYIEKKEKIIYYEPIEVRINKENIINILIEYIVKQCKK